MSITKPRPTAPQLAAWRQLIDVLHTFVEEDEYFSSGPFLQLSDKGKIKLLDFITQPNFKMSNSKAPKTEQTSSFVTHWMIAGEAVCGQEGLPEQWPPNHRWVSRHTGIKENVTCPDCRKRLDQG